MTKTKSGKSFKSTFVDYRDNGGFGPATVYWAVKTIQRELGRDTLIGPNDRLNEHYTIADYVSLEMRPYRVVR